MEGIPGGISKGTPGETLEETTDEITEQEFPIVGTPEGIHVEVLGGTSGGNLG